ncbi:hypothetical protein [Rhodococcus sp. NPDC006774]|uniref:hypothetical protein n=1 Tax=Rhodococcus sp. NPDC006774 TaxID=3157186 RepID=UPI0033CDBC95
MTQPATTQELIADVLYRHFTDDEQAWNIACEIERDPALTVRPRVYLMGDRATVLDQLERLPEGAQIRWKTGEPIHVALAIKIVDYAGKNRWSATAMGSSGYISSESIARDNTPIEVLA